MRSAQPPGARGTVGHPYSALNLRLLFAAIGVVLFLVLTILMFALDLPVLAWIAVVFLVIGVVDLIIIAQRIRARRRTDSQHHSLFE
jgi:Flp pilus assembly protein TadB